MKKLLILPVFLFSLAPLPVKANPYQMGMQWCSMVRSGMDAAASWKMIQDSYVNGRFQNTSRGDPYAPWSPTRTWSGAIGAGIGEGITGGLSAAMDLNRMLPDIIRTTDANCHEYGLRFESRAQRRKRTNKNKLPMACRNGVWDKNHPKCKGS